MDTPNPAIDLLERDIAARLRPLCGHLSAESFDELVKDIVRVKLKYGLESLPTEQLHGAIADVMIQANASSHTEENGSSQH